MTTRDDRAAARDHWPRPRRHRAAAGTTTGPAWGSWRRSRPLRAVPDRADHLRPLLSLFNSSLVESGLGSWAGLGNYAEMLGSSEFWSSLWHTIYFTILTTPPLVILAFVFALLANRAVRGRVASSGSLSSSRTSCRPP